MDITVLVAEKEYIQIHSDPFWQNSLFNKVGFVKKGAEIEVFTQIKLVCPTTSHVWRRLTTEDEQWVVERHDNSKLTYLSDLKYFTPV